MNDEKFVLASQSPRRRALVSLTGYEFESVSVETDEIIDLTMRPEEAIMALALSKTRSVLKDYPDRMILGADTIVYIDGVHLGKPEDRDDAFRMLKLLSGRTHKVITGCALNLNGQSVTFHSETKVVFNPMTDAEIEDYVATGEPFNKAGSYAIQGYGARFVKYIEGDYHTVMGLPVSKLYRYLKDFENGVLFTDCNLR